MQSKYYVTHNPSVRVRIPIRAFEEAAFTPAMADISQISHRYLVDIYTDIYWETQKKHMTDIPQISRRYLYR
jgi:hypothetical protein